jgi:hypothetical protein
MSSYSSTSSPYSSAPSSFYTNNYDIERSAIPHDYRSNVYYAFFGKANVNYISSEITNRLDGSHPEGKNIIVPHDKILSIMDSFYSNTYKDVDKMTMMTISYIVDTISSEYQIEKQNNELDIWVINHPPEYGMQRTPKLKMREKRPTPFMFNMNY